MYIRVEYYGGNTMEHKNFKELSRSAKLHELLRQDKESMINNAEGGLSSENSPARFSVPEKESKLPYKSPYNVNSHII